MNGRLYDPKLGRFLSPDNFVQDPFNTQNFNRYGYVVNNPLMYVDESGEFFFSAALIGAVVSILTNGINNAIHHQPFFHGALQAGITGFIGGAVSLGIGNVVSQMATQGVSKLGQIAFQTIAHSYLGGFMSAMSGGDVGAGMLSGALGSLSAFGAGKLLKNASNFWQGAGMIGTGAVMGGVSSSIAGGNFWDGFRNGAISAGLNHAMHSYAGKLQQKITIKRLLSKAGYGTGHTPNDIPTYTQEYLKKMVDKIPYLADKLAEAGDPDYHWDESLHDVNGEYVAEDKTIWLSTHKLDSHFSVLSTFLHETYHAWQHHSGYLNYIIKTYGPITRNSHGNLSNVILEMNAHAYIMGLEGYHSFNTYFNDFKRLTGYGN